MYSSQNATKVTVKGVFDNKIKVLFKNNFSYYSCKDGAAYIWAAVA